MSNKQTLHANKLIIANCSGFLGDRFNAVREMIQGGPIDILTGDYLAELTMAILFRKTLKNPEGGYAAAFLRQMKDVMRECMHKNIRIVANAGGLNPRSLARQLENLAVGSGIEAKVAYIEGDNLAEYEIERYELPNLLALNFYIKGVLGEGAAASLRNDGQAKTLGEYLRAKIVEMPESIVIRSFPEAANLPETG